MIRLSAFADEAHDSLEGQIAALQRNNIPYIELRGINGTNIAKVTEEQAVEYAAQLKAGGIKVWAIGSPIGKVYLHDDLEAHMQQLRHICRLAKIFGTEKIRMFSFKRPWDQEPMVYEYLRKMVQIATEEGCVLYHENEKAIFGDTAERVMRIMQNVEGLKYVYDPANFLEVGESADVTLAPLFDKMDYFHIKDVIAETKQLVPAGHGDGRIAELIARIGCCEDRVLTIEPHLKVFSGYGEIDDTKMNNKYCYATNGEAFDAAVAALKKLLLEGGYKETEGGFVKV